MAKRPYNPQRHLHQALANGRIAGAEKARADGAVLLAREATTDAERQMLTRERQELWRDALSGKSPKAVEWLIAQDASFASPEFLSYDNLKEWLKDGLAALGPWVADRLLPSIQPALGHPHWKELWDLAIFRADNVGVEWMLHHTPKESRPDVWNLTLHHTSWWQIDPIAFTDRCALLVEHGHRWETPASATPALETWLRRYRLWTEGTDGSKRIREDYETQAPRLWELFVAAGADPAPQRMNGQRVTDWVADLPLGAYLRSQARLETLTRVGSAEPPPAGPAGRRRVRS